MNDEPDDWDDLTEEQKEFRRRFWRPPKSVIVNALHHDGLKTYPGCPTVPCFKTRGLWMRDLGIDTGMRLYLYPEWRGFRFHADPPPKDQEAVKIYRKVRRW